MGITAAIAAIVAFIVSSLGAIAPSAPATRAQPHLAVADRLGTEGGAGQLIVVEAAGPADT